jgi:hypothetical protein
MPPARGRSIGRNRVDRALGRCPQGPAAASNWGKFEANKWGDSLPARDLHRQRALFARHGGKCRAQALSRILCGKAESGGRHQTILGRLPQRATGAIRYGGALSRRASLATLADAGENTRHRFTRITLSYRAGRQPEWRSLDRSRSIRRWKLAFRVEFPARRLRGTLRV